MRPAASRPDRDGTLRSGPRRRILLAEDDLAFRSFLAAALRKDGHEVIEASDGFELVQRLATSRRFGPGPLAFDIVISDVRMPGWTGLEVLEALNRQPLVPPFVLITAFGDPDFERRALAVGALATLSKPFDVEQLRTIVASAGDQHGSG